MLSLSELLLLGRPTPPFTRVHGLLWVSWGSGLDPPSPSTQESGQNRSTATTTTHEDACRQLPLSGNGNGTGKTRESNNSACKTVNQDWIPSHPLLRSLAGLGPWQLLLRLRAPVDSCLEWEWSWYKQTCESNNSACKTVNLTGNARVSLTLPFVTYK